MLAFISSCAAEMVATPSPTALTMPLSSMVATLGLEEKNSARLVTSPTMVLSSERRTMTRCVAPGPVSVTAAGWISSDGWAVMNEQATRHADSIVHLKREGSAD